MVEGATMEEFRRRGWEFVACAGWCMLAASVARGGEPSDCAAITFRLIHPDQQAAALIKLFDGSRAAHPAAALAGWKRATRDPAQLGKTVEAVIALANSDMVPEWKVFHQAELRVNLGADDAAPRWHAVLPGDDGAAAAMITAFRLSDLEDPPPIDKQGREFLVTRFSRSSHTVMTRVGSVFVLAGSRDDLAAGLRRFAIRSAAREPAAAGMSTIGETKWDHEFGRLADKVRSGLVFALLPSQIAMPIAGSLELRRAVELLHSLDIGQVTGSLGLEGEQLSLQVTTKLGAVDSTIRRAQVREGERSGEPGPGAARTDFGLRRAQSSRELSRAEPRPPGGPRSDYAREAPPSVDRAWLALIPVHDLIALVSLAVDGSPRFWDRVFAVADRVERVDPEYRDVASLRTRFNLMAKGGRLRPEADLWPHLRGVTGAAIADIEHPGRMDGVMVVLHADTEVSAAHLADEFVPRLAELGKGKLALLRAAKAAKAREGERGDIAPSAVNGPRPLGTIGGRSLALRRLGRDVLVGWGGERTVGTLGLAGRSGRSAADVCGHWSNESRPRPARVGAVWPGRLPLPGLSSRPITAPARVLSDDPPVVWWGWNEPTEAHDVVFWSRLKSRVRQFLAELPMDAPPYR
jgi:hypothetical protein